MHTRKQYIHGECSHADYYGQFVTPEVRAMLLRCITPENIRAAYKRDENLNTIPLGWWDIFTLPSDIPQKMKEAGDFLTLAGQICILKEAARQIITEARHD